MYRVSRESMIGLLLIGLAAAPLAPAAEPAAADGPPAAVAWHDDYAAAYEKACDQCKMLLLVFRDPKPTPADTRFRETVLNDRSLVGRLAEYVCADLAIDARVVVGGKSRRLLDEPGMAPLDGAPGMIVIDLAHADHSSFGKAVSAMPFAGDTRFTVAQMSTLLDLPAGTLEVRSAEYARRAEHLATETEPKPAEPSPAKPAPAQVAERTPFHWINDYADAHRAAERQHKMLLILFADPAADSLGQHYESEILCRPAVREKLADFVLAKLPLDAEFPLDGKPARVIQQSAFAEMLGREGVAMVDFVHADREEYRCVVSEFPFLKGRLYTEEQTLVMLNLPPGTLTQRTLIYAVRTHPEHPASTNGTLDPNLAAEARSHSGYQARIRLQGHHNWDTRFHRLNRLLPRGLMAREVCAESWPGQRLLEAAIECVRCWRYSSAHWSAVGANKPYYGYDMKQGSNGVWYATGLFADQGD